MMGISHISRRWPPLLPQYVLDARAQITEQMNEADGRIESDSGGDYWGGYYDACRHALKAIPPHLVRPDAEDLVLDDTARAEPSPARRAALSAPDLREYAAHQSWRCEHPDRYPWDPDCCCGLTAVLRRLGSP